MKSKRFVLDTNIWISYIITGRELELLKIKVSHKLSLVVCNELLSEIKRVLEYPQIKKYGVNPKAALRFIKSFTVIFTIQYPIKDYLTEDPDDNYIIALALQSNAGYVTSGDRHILSMKHTLEGRYRNLRIISKSAFEKMFIKPA